ncbi:sensor histidine kinase [Plantactinospora sp. CA-290183]|uniref:sensor histidine kinase n=1 Tax=Plantactinospora sp. CA-290183 TaxID=3240006 RepID=UPI003D9047F7
MSTGGTSLPESGLPARSDRRRWFPRLRDARIRSKLALILVVPVVAVLALATVRLVDVGQRAYDASMIRSLTALSAEVSGLVQDVHKERMAAAALLAVPNAKPDSFNGYVRATDDRINRYREGREGLGGIPDAIDSRLRAIDAHLVTLNSTRQEVLDREQMPVAEAVLRYGVILTDLVSYAETLGQLAGEGGVAEDLRAVAAFAKAKAAIAEEEAVAYAALSVGRIADEQFSSFVATLTSQQEALLAFSLTASEAQRVLVDRTVTGDAVALADRIAADISRSTNVSTPLVTAAQATSAIGAVNDLMRWAEIRLETDLLARADQARSDVLRQALVEAGLVILTLIVAIVLAVVLARSLNQSLRRLREGALSVANHDLPEAVKRLRDVGNVGDGGVEEIVRQVRDPIRLTNKDEVGQVALAFNVVHREAVRIAAEQAALRTSVSAMFLSLARRSQTLVDRMIGELDTIERGEEDPKRLAKLFELDHLATRMRRNDENLLVLAGADSTAPRREDALLIDALRAAQSEVELYNRIEFGTVDIDISVAAHAVNDVVRLLAELLDNATRFSPPHTTVVADARRIRDYVLVQVEDRGLGLSDEQMDALNRRLAAPPTVDVAAFRLMGLAVVSRLASRHGIRVDLRRNVEGGTVAQVTLPASTVVLPVPRGRDQILSRPRQPLAVEPAPTAAPSSVPSTGQGWSDTLAPAGASRATSATLTEQWRSVAPAQWQPAAEPAAPVPVNAATNLASNQYSPVPTYQPASPVAQSAAPAPTAPPPAHPGLAEFGGASPTMAYPTVAGALPRRGSGGGQAAAPAAASSHLPSGPVAGAPAAPAAVAPRLEDSGEAPIFREMEAVWFRSHGQDSTAIFTVPPGGYQTPPPPAATRTVTPPAEPPPPAAPAPSAAAPTSQAGAGTPGRVPLATRTPGSNVPPPAPYAPPSVPAPAHVPAAAPAPAASPVAPPPPAGTSRPEGGWRTAADEGWALASRAAEPAAGGTTRSGLPKRVPQAQLVPGGVEPRSGREPTRRTPDEVRGLLSAYHRGVQRGRSAGMEQNGTISTKETSG